VGRGSRFILAMTAAVGITATLYFGRPLILPFVVALLATMLLSPASQRLQRWGVPRLPASVGVVVAAFGLLVAGGWLLTVQAVSLSQNLPGYRENVTAKARMMAESIGPVFGRSRSAALEIQKQLGALWGESMNQGPLKVEVVDSSPKLLLGVAGAVVNAVAEGSVVLLLVCFFLIYHADLRDRLIRLIGDRDVGLTTQAMDEAATGISRYLMIHSVLNALHGALLGLGLWALGVPHALLWGMIGAIVRFIPYLGPLISAVLPSLLAMAVFEGFGRPLTVVGFIVALELVSNNVLEPWLYGRRTGLSPLAVVVAAVFWATVWGPFGLLLAVPLSVCLLVLGRRVPGLEFLAVLLGTDTPLEPRVRVYQRLLAGDPEEAIEAVEEWQAAHPVDDPRDALLLPVVALAAAQRRSDRLDPARWEIFQRSLKETIEGLEEPPPPSTSVNGVRVLCVPADDAVDDAACDLVARALRHRGIETEVVEAGTPPGEAVDRIERSGSGVVCISATPPGAFTRARYLHKLLRRKRADIPVMIGLWALDGDPAPLRERHRLDARTFLITSVEQAVARIREERVNVEPARKA
jgi:predicted PurR-regulated permease PerM